VAFLQQHVILGFHPVLVLRIDPAPMWAHVLFLLLVALKRPCRFIATYLTSMLPFVIQISWTAIRGANILLPSSASNHFGFFPCVYPQAAASRPMRVIQFLYAAF
jgi:hypothetical protein